MNKWVKYFGICAGSIATSVFLESAAHEGDHKESTLSTRVTTESVSDEGNEQQTLLSLADHLLNPFSSDLETIKKDIETKKSFHLDSEFILFMATSCIENDQLNEELFFQTLYSFLDKGSFSKASINPFIEDPLLKIQNKEIGNLNKPLSSEQLEQIRKPMRELLSSPQSQGYKGDTFERWMQPSSEVREIHTRIMLSRIQTFALGTVGTFLSVICSAFGNVLLPSLDDPYVKKFINNSIQALCKNAHLTSLDLSDTGLDTVSFQILAESLRSNVSLKELSLDNSEVIQASPNKPGTEGLVALFESLKGNNTLTSLSLKRNVISAKGGHVLVEMLGKNGTLTNLDLEECIDEPWMAVTYKNLRRIFAKRPSLKTNINMPAEEKLENSENFFSTLHLVLKIRDASE